MGINSWREFQAERLQPRPLAQQHQPLRLQEVPMRSLLTCLLPRCAL